MESGVPLTLHAAPASGFEEPFAMLSACHERVQRMLALLARLDEHLARKGLDDQAADAARDVMRYFDRAAPAHHDDEERHVLPALRASGDATLVALAARLHEDHEAMSATWAALRPHLQQVVDAQSATGAVPSSTPLANQASTPRVGLGGPWREFAALYDGHIEAEESVAFPQAAAVLQGEARAAMGREMAARRGLPSLPAAPAAT